MWNNNKRSVLKNILKPNKNNNNSNKQVEAPVNLSTRPPRSNGGVDFILPGGIGGGFDMLGPDIGEVTYFTVLRVLSEGVGKLPIHIKDKNHEIVDNRAEYLLNVSPNNGMTPVMLLSYLEYCRNHYGNGYAFVKWNEKTGNLENVIALDPRMVRLWVDDVSGEILTKYYYSYTALNGNSYFLPAEDVIHVRSWHLDDRTRLLGLPVRVTLAEYMTAAKAGQATQNSLYENGMISSGVLNYVGDLSESRRDDLMSSIKKIGGKSKIIPLPQDWKLTPINLSLADNQYLETRKYTGSQIAAAFGVNPTQLNDYSRGSYNNAMEQQIAFLKDTMLYISRQYEDELTLKLLTETEIKKGYRVDMDTDAILQQTPDVLSVILQRLVTSSIMTINEAREKAGLSPRENCDTLMTMPGAKTVEKEVVVE